MHIACLPIFIIIHWVISLSLSFYVFFRKSNTYDWLYFSTLCFVIISWTLMDSECIISYLEKICLDESYIFKSDPSILPHINLIFGKYSNIALTSITLFTIYNVYTILTLYKVPIQIILTFIYFILYPGMKYRIDNMA